MHVLENKVAIVTGASSGIGRATALLFASAGAAVVLGARRKPELERLEAEIKKSGACAVSMAGDVRHEKYAQALVQAAMNTFGGLDVAFNNASVLGDTGPAPDISAAGWRSTMETNLTSAFYGAKYQIPAMLARGSGSIIFTSTFVGFTTSFPGAAAYAASKAGLIGLTQALAAEFQPKAIRINAIFPGAADTATAYETNASPEAITRVENLHALERIAKPEGMARSALYLASDASSFMTGAALLVDGGVSINRA